ncbi:MAG: hypothetical protein ACHQ50_03570 [Fimbriimonadales bacterium]
MDLNGLNAACWMVFGILATIGLANLADYGLRTMAENKARRAEMIRFRKWGLPAPKRPEEPRCDEHLWHF